MPDQLFAPQLRALDRNGEPQSGALGYTYIGSTMTALTVTDYAGTPLAWPMTADTNGVFPQFFYDGPEAVKLIVTDADGAILPGYPVDPCIRVPVVTTQASGISFGASTNVPETDVQAAIDFVGDRLADIAAETPAGTGLVGVTGTLETGLTINVPAATKAEAEAGTLNTKAMTPLRTQNAIDAAVADLPFTEEYVSSQQTITSAGLLTLTHGLTARPKLMALELVCTVTDNGYAVDDVVVAGLNNSTDNTPRFNALWATDTQIKVRFSSDSQCFVLGNPTTGALFNATNSKWKLVVRAWA